MHSHTQRIGLPCSIADLALLTPRMCDLRITDRISMAIAGMNDDNTRLLPGARVLIIRSAICNLC